MAAERNAWQKLRQGLLAEWGFLGAHFRIEAPASAPAFPDLIAFKDSRTWFIELKAWEAPHGTFRPHDIVWRPGQELTLRQIARTHCAVAAVLCAVKIGRTTAWHWGIMDGLTGLWEWSDRTP